MYHFPIYGDRSLIGPIACHFISMYRSHSRSLLREPVPLPDVSAYSRPEQEHWLNKLTLHQTVFFTNIEKFTKNTLSKLDLFV